MFVCRRRLFSTASVLRNTDAALGLRSQRPPDTQPDPKTPPEISDHEWELRTGRAIHILQQTLPEFFETGLITSSSDSATGLRPILGSVVGAPAPNDLDSIYSPNIRLSYTPPGNLPPPLPKTLHIEGISMYLASSVFVRHTMNAVYSETRVALNKVAVESRGGKKSREKSLVVGLTASGVARVSGAASEWEVNSTYTFSPLTGLIHIHTVNSIHPAPHQAVYDALRFNVFSGSGREQGPAANTTAKDS
ncbi:hypothetical protein HMN09_00749000 [Mycena chlorophos]|uniref:Uncharacterized protein n=2 Tax=Mycena chlorophos TaxID=658473 RepID=A0A146IM05_MYCCL|nr:hypothetical protein HMN09_00749000 [Mycena chlorophos]GAT60602.1 predicted protein [Mycena chlorophos]